MKDIFFTSIKQPSGNLVVVENTAVKRKIDNELIRYPANLKRYISKRNEEDKNSSNNIYSILRVKTDKIKYKK